MTILAILTCLAIVVRFMRRARVHGALLPQNNAQRHFLWDLRLDAEIGSDSERRLELQARGAAAKRRIMAHLRNAQRAAEQHERERIAAGKKRERIVFALERHRDGPLTTVVLELRPLSIAANDSAPSVPVVVRRPKLSLAR